MFKWPNTPSPRAREHELADFAELLCWKEGTASITDLSQALGRIAENEYKNGVPEEEEDVPMDMEIEGAFVEIERRKEACGGGYPFHIGENGSTIYAAEDVLQGDRRVYKYLLLATRLNMGTGKQSERMQDGIDGTLILEELSAETCREYFGKRAESMVFGTAAGSGNFPQKIDDLCGSIREGDGFKSSANNMLNIKDGKLDVVAWKHFSDELAGKLIAFGQCKTGTSFWNTLTQLQPDSFCRKWVQSALSKPPLSMFFVAEALHPVDWFGTAADVNGLLFDRCRIVDFSKRTRAQVLQKMEIWTRAAAEATELPPP